MLLCVLSLCLQATQLAMLPATLPAMLSATLTPWFPALPSAHSKKMNDILSQHLTCPMCYDWLLASHTLSCGHMFCGLCLATWLAQKQSCPTCRNPIVGKCWDELSSGRTIN